MKTIPPYATRDALRPDLIAVLAALHILALAAPFTFTWIGLGAFVVITYLTTGFGITMGYHRLLTHSSYKAIRPVKYVLTFLACLALQGGPIFWVATHRYHHKVSDKPGDPHSPVNGFWWSHVVWAFFHHPKTRTMAESSRLVPDLAADPVMRFFERFYFVLFVVTAAVVSAIGYHFGGARLAWSLFIWGFAFRVVYGWHITWLVNSATHMWGYQNYRLSDDSRNLWWLALLTYGEGWHNNHHSDQRSAKFGHRWFELDVTYYLICLMERLGWASDVSLPRLAKLSLKRMERSSATRLAS